MKSKRSALRYGCENELISLKNAYDEGEAQLANISTDGCAFLKASLALEVGEKILVSMVLGDNYKFEARAVVVRMDQLCTAVQFDLVEPKCQSRLRQHFRKKKQ